MFIFHHATDLQSYLAKERVNNRTVGFVPTMGALHEGHLSLIEHSKIENQITVCSIFVNPTQFNDPTDLEKYPRTPAKDILALEKVGCEVVFLPSVEQVYPPNLTTTLNIDLKGLDEPMEGAERPGHFKGVIQVVNRLLDLVIPDFLYMGQKDYQQFLICKKMIEALNKPVKIRKVPIMRAADGLALSSRNVRLPEEHRLKANLLYQMLTAAKEKIEQGMPSDEIQNWALEQLAAPDFRPEYFSIVDAETLTQVENGDDKKQLVACTAVWLGEVRLIDNMILRS